MFASLTGRLTASHRRPGPVIAAGVLTVARFYLTGTGEPPC